MITLVCGPPAGGKSTWVQRYAAPGELVVCFDHLARQAGSTHRHLHSPEQREAAGQAYERALRRLAAGEHDTAWVIRCAASPDERDELASHIRAQRVIVLLPGLHETLARARRDRRARHTYGAIHRWYAGYRPRPGDEVLTPEPLPRMVTQRDRRIRPHAPVTDRDDQGECPRAR